MNYFLDKDGYKILNKGKTREHRLVMEDYLGRKLNPAEQVHHLDGNKLNNKIDNLVLCANGSEHLKKYHSNVWNKGKHKLVVFECRECGKTTKRRLYRGSTFCSVECASKAGLRAAVIKNTKYTEESFCRFLECDRKPKARGYCKYHYYKEVYPYLNNL